MQWFKADVCYEQCTTTSLIVNGTRIEVEDSCNSDDPTIVECARGYACNIMVLVGKTQALEAGREDTLQLNLVGCGLLDEACDVYANAMRTTALPDLEAKCSVHDLDDFKE